MTPKHGWTFSFRIIRWFICSSHSSDELRSQRSSVESVMLSTEQQAPEEEAVWPLIASAHPEAQLPVCVHCGFDGVARKSEIKASRRAGTAGRGVAGGSERASAEGAS